MVIERLLGAGSVCMLIAVLAVSNEDINRFLAGLLSGDMSTGLFVLGWRTLRIVTSGTEPLVSYMSDHLALAGFGLGAVVLVGLMLRA